MRHLYTLFLLLISYSLLNIVPPRSFAAQPIKVVTTLTLLEDFVRNVGGERVEVRSLLSGLESEHTYTPKPSDIVAVKEARMLIKIGLGLEVWVDSLIKNASNSRLVVVNTSSGIPLLRSEGIGARQGHIEQIEKMDSNGHDGHLGNPHIWLDPERSKVIIRHITEALSDIDPEGRNIYLTNQAGYFKKIDAMRSKVEDKLRPVKSRKIITHHPAWPYFAQRFKLQIVDNIQLQAGTEPSARHIANIINRIKKEDIRVIVSEPQLNPKVPKSISEETNAKMIILTPIPGGLPGTGTYIEMMEYNAEQLSSALR